MKHSIIGTAGHVDHGKSLLIKALTGIDTDRLKEEKKRGITIDLGFAWLDLPGGGKAGIVDVPGHEKFISNMLAGAGGIDLVLLIVAADEGVMPQTREHLDILQLLGIPQGIIVLTKKDLVSSEWLELVQEDVRSVCTGTFLEKAPLCAVSAYTGDGIAELRELIISILTKLDSTKSLLPFRQPIDRVFSMEGFGTVVTGTIIEGQVQVGETVMLYPSETGVRVRNIQIHGQDQICGFAGQRAAINLASISRADVLRGEVLAQSYSLIPSRMLDVKIKILSNSPYTIKSGSYLHLHHGASETIARLRLFDCNELWPGQIGWGRLSVDENIVAAYGDRFILRFFSPLHTVGGGIVLDPAPVTIKVNSQQWTERLQSLATDDIRQRLILAIDSASPHFGDLKSALKRAGADQLPTEKVKATLEQLESDKLVFTLRDQTVLSSKFIEDLQRIVINILTLHHEESPLSPGIKREELRTRILPEAKLNHSDSIISLLVDRGVIVETAGIISLPDFRVVLTPAQERAQQELLDIYLEQGFSPEDTEQILVKIDHKLDPNSLLSDLISRGLLVRLNTQIVMHRDNIEKARELALSILHESGELRLGDFRDQIGSSRKYAVAILDYFDRINLTKLCGDVRKLISH